MSTSPTPMPTASSHLSTSTSQSPLSCYRCGNITSGQACTLSEVYTGGSGVCGDAGDYCMTSVYNDGLHQKIYKRFNFINLKKKN